EMAVLDGLKSRGRSLVRGSTSKRMSGQHVPLEVSASAICGLQNMDAASSAIDPAARSKSLEPARLVLAGFSLKFSGLLAGRCDPTEFDRNEILGKRLDVGRVSGFALGQREPEDQQQIEHDVLHRWAWIRPMGTE